MGLEILWQEKAHELVHLRLDTGSRASNNLRDVDLRADGSAASCNTMRTVPHATLHRKCSCGFAGPACYCSLVHVSLLPRRLGILARHGKPSAPDLVYPPRGHCLGTPAPRFMVRHHMLVAVGLASPAQSEQVLRIPPDGPNADIGREVSRWCSHNAPAGVCTIGSLNEVQSDGQRSFTVANNAHRSTQLSTYTFQPTAKQHPGPPAMRNGRYAY